MAQKVLICLQRGAFQVLVIRIIHRCCFSFAYRIFIVAYEFIQCPQYTSWVSRYHSYSFSFETEIRTQDSVVVVCNLDGKIDRTTVWENGTQNSGLVNFGPGISFTICTNHFHLSKKRPRGNETDGFVEIEHEFPFGIFRPEKQENLFRCSARTTKKVMFQPGFPEAFL